MDRVIQKHYPFSFVLDDALDYLKSLIVSGEVAEFDFIHASPPCQLYSQVRYLMKNTDGLQDLIPDTRVLLSAAGLPWVIENVKGAPLIDPVMVCGTMLRGLKVIRHRYFECSPALLMSPGCCNHWGKATSCNSRRGKTGPSRVNSLKDGYAFVTVVGGDYLAPEGRLAMGIDWMIKKELSQAIPPAYTEWIGRQMLKRF